MYSKKECLEIVCGLGTPSKMPCFSYSLSAKSCKMGALISKNKDSICGKCYAKRGHYMYGVVANSHAKRLNAIRDPRWVECMSSLIHDMRFFRWHDSGDIQDIEHLQKNC